MKKLLPLLSLLITILFTVTMAQAHEVSTEYRQVSVYDFCSAIPPATCDTTVGDPLLKVESSVTQTGTGYNYTWDIACVTGSCETLTIQTAEVGTCASLSSVQINGRTLADNRLGGFATDPQGVTCVSLGTPKGAIIVNFNLGGNVTALNRVSLQSTCAPAYVTYRTKGSPSDAISVLGNGGGTILAPWCGVAVTDTDNDGRDDSLDNCTLVANGPAAPDAGGHVQNDVDSDGYGNICDADFDNDGDVDDDDYILFQLAFFGTDPLYDLDGDGYVNYADLNIFSVLHGSPPGPSGVTP